MALATTTQILETIKQWVLDRLQQLWALIPLQASAENQLADKAFVNSSIATATATFRGTFNLVSDLGLSTEATQQQIAAAIATEMEALGIMPDSNDYCFIQIPDDDSDPDMIARIDRYKYDGSAWGYEFSLNNSGFTAAQWAAINSGITSESWADTPEFVEEDPSQTELVEQYAQILQQLYQGITDAQNAKADYVGNDNYVYRWNAVQGVYEKTNLYVKGDPGTTDYTQLVNRPSQLSQFIDDLGNNPTHDHASLVNSGSYNSTTKKIELKHDSTVLATIDATAFIKDGMVDSVVVAQGNLVITFNTDSGKEPITIPLTSIFNPANYYDKTATDQLLAQKVNNSDITEVLDFVEDNTDTWPF